MKANIFLTAVLSSILLAGCYYDADERINYDLSNDCDPLNVTYTTCVKPIMDNKCKGCHSASNASGGVKLDNYTNVKAHYTASMVTIHAGTMPQGSGKLPQSEITTLEDWSTQGFKE